LDTDEFLHVKRTVNVSDVSQSVFSASKHAVHLADVGAIVAGNHDGVQGRRRSFEVNQQASFVAF